MQKPIGGRVKRRLQAKKLVGGLFASVEKQIMVYCVIQ
jgi:hypothetical protein